jgi:flagellar motility protein MotE (MotC chaperone)
MKKPFLSFRRVLPIVATVGGLLLVVKGEGVVHGALAAGLDGLGGDPAILAEDTAPLGTDGIDGSEESAGKVDVMNSLSKRREMLDRREADIEQRAQLLAATEKRIDGKIATLKTLQDQIGQMLGQRDTEEQKQFASLVKTYSSMKPKDAARIFNTLADDVLVPVAAAIKADVMAPILAGMNSEAAQALTVKLANRLKLPPVAAPALQTDNPALICTPQGDGTSPPPPQPPAKRG